VDQVEEGSEVSDIQFGMILVAIAVVNSIITRWIERRGK
jgi:hypothetical protein